MQRNKAIFYGSAFVIAMLTSSYSCTMGPDEAVKLVYETTKKAGGGILQSVVGAGACAELAVNVYTIGKDTTSYVCPNEKEQADIRATGKEMEIMTLKKALRECLIENRVGAQMGPLDAPAMCEDLIIILSSRGKADVANRMVTFFNKLNKK